VELVDTLDLGSSAARCEGSSPFRPTIFEGKCMKIEELTSKTLYKEYFILIPYEELDGRINEKIQELIPSTTIPGFRKGKAPNSIVRKKYEDTVLNEVLQKLLNSKVEDFIKSKNFKLFRQPRIDLKNYEKNKPLEINLKVDLQPDINLIDYKKIKLNKYEINLSTNILEKNFNEFISSQKNYKVLNTKRSLKKSDKVIINLETDNENIPAYLKSQKNLPIDTESDQELLPNLSQELISKKVKKGDRLSISFNLSETLKDNKFENIMFNIEVISIEEKTKFELTKEFLEKNGFKSDKDLKNYLNDNLKQHHKRGLIQIEKKQLMDKLNKEYDFDLPEGVLEDDYNDIIHKLELAKKDGTLDEDDKSLNDEQLKKRYKKISKRRVKLGVLLQHIAKEENVVISEEDLSKGIYQYASQYPGQEKQIIEYIKNKPSALESIKSPLLEQKVIDIIISKCNVKKVKINEKEYKKLEVDTFSIKKEKN
tara:strand:+ start:129 stop:1574 length:1446 start_codon:yes stop_codon:yes gene_type:complete